jgi:hypothetical protein
VGSLAGTPLFAAAMNLRCLSFTMEEQCTVAGTSQLYCKRPVWEPGLESGRYVSLPGHRSAKEAVYRASCLVLGDTGQRPG